MVIKNRELFILVKDPEYPENNGRKCLMVNNGEYGNGEGKFEFQFDGDSYHNFGIHNHDIIKPLNPHSETIRGLLKK